MPKIDVLAPTRPSARLAGLLLLAAAALVVGVPQARAAVPLELVYRVSHSLVGELGSYTCTVERLGNGGTEIRVREHIDARMLGIPVYRMDAANTERWRGDRLVSLHAVTEEAGGRTEIRGELQGNRFVITSPRGRMTAAASVHPVEPCAANFLQSTTILRPDTGGIEQVRVSGGAATSITLDGAVVPVRKYVLAGSTRYTVWLDSRNLPVMFAIDDDNGRATFTLAKCISCDPTVIRSDLE